MTDERCALRVSNRPENRSFPDATLADEPARNSLMSFSASSRVVRLAASFATNALILASSFHLSWTSSSDGPAHTAATEISGTLACAHGQSGYRGSAAKPHGVEAATASSAPVMIRQFTSRLRHGRGG